MANKTKPFFSSLIGGRSFGKSTKNIIYFSVTLNVTNPGQKRPGKQ